MIYAFNAAIPGRIFPSGFQLAPSSGRNITLIGEAKLFNRSDRIPPLKENAPAAVLCTINVPNSMVPLAKLEAQIRLMVHSTKWFCFLKQPF